MLPSRAAGRQRGGHGNGAVERGKKKKGGSLVSITVPCLCGRCSQCGHSKCIHHLPLAPAFPPPPSFHFWNLAVLPSELRTRNPDLSGKEKRKKDERWHRKAEANALQQCRRPNFSDAEEDQKLAIQQRFVHERCEASSLKSLARDGQ